MTIREFYAHCVDKGYLDMELNIMEYCADEDGRITRYFDKDDIHVKNNEVFIEFYNDGCVGNFDYDEEDWFDDDGEYIGFWEDEKSDD